MRTIKKFAWLALALGALVPASYGQSGLGGQSQSFGGGYGGPAVLGRGAGSTTGTRGVAEMGIRYYVGLQGTADSGLTSLQVDDNGNLKNFSAKGAEVTFGVYGVKRYKRASIGVNYFGSYRQYTNQPKGSGFNGTDQSLGIFAAKQFSARSAMQFSSSLGTSNRAFGLPGLGGYIDPNIGSVISPTADLFDNRFYYGNGTVGYIYQRTARSSVSVFGTGFLVRRTGNVLYGSNGTTAGVDYAYRLSRTQTIHVGYNYLFFNFTRNFGDTSGHGINIGYSQVFARKYNLSLRGGANRLDILGLRTAKVDPAIAALIGFSSTSVVYYNTPILPNVTAQFTGPITRRTSFGLSGGIQPGIGNGIVNNTRNYTAGTSFNYTGTRNISFSFGSYFNQMSSVDGLNQQFRSVSTSLTASRRIRSDLHATLSAGDRKFLTNSYNNFRKNSVFFTIGLYYSPGEIPLSIR